MILTEHYDSRACGSQLKLFLKQAGFAVVTTEHVVIASRRPLERISSSDRLLEVRVPDWDLVVLGVYVHPTRSRAQTELLDQILEFAYGQTKSRTLIAGDFNSCDHADCSKGRSIYNPKKMAKFAEIFVDLWKLGGHPDSTPYTWWHGETGFRLDHLLASPKLQPSKDTIVVRHDLQTDLSDHAAVIVDGLVNLPPTPGSAGS